MFFYLSFNSCREDTNNLCKHIYMSPFFLFFVTACVVVALGVIGVCYDVIHVRSTDLAIRLKSMFVCEELSTFGCGFL